MGGASAFPVVVTIIGCGIATVGDVRRRRIYNALTLPLLLSGLIYHVVTGGMGGLGASLAGMAFGFFFIFIPYLIGIMGGGDVKLLAAIGAWLGLGGVMLVTAIGCAVAGLYSLVVLLRQGRLGDSWLGLQLAVVRLHSLAGQLGCEEEREDFRAQVRQAKTQRRRVVPFSVMLTIALVVAGGIQVWAAP